MRLSANTARPSGSTEITSVPINLEQCAEAHNNLGAALAEKGQLDGAIGEFREAIGLKKDYTKAHNNLGNGSDAGRGLPLRARGILGERERVNPVTPSPPGRSAA